MKKDAMKELGSALTHVWNALHADYTDCGSDYTGERSDCNCGAENNLTRILDLFKQQQALSDAVGQALLDRQEGQPIKLAKVREMLITLHKRLLPDYAEDGIAAFGYELAANAILKEHGYEEVEKP